MNAAYGSTGVSITVPTNGQNLCSATAIGGALPAFTTLTDIVLTESAVADFSTGNIVFTLVVPSGWQFNTGAAVTATPTGADITGIDAVGFTDANHFHITVHVGTVASMDNITISGLQVQATGTGSGGVTITSTLSGGTFAGITTGTSFAALSLTGPDIIAGPSVVCLTSVGMAITLSDATPGGSWTTSNANITLTSSTLTQGSFSVAATGTTTITYTSAGCIVVKTVTVNSLPTIAPVNTGGPVCVGALLTFTATATAGSAGGSPTFSWNGPAALAAIGTPSITTTSTAQGGTYTVTVSDAACSNKGTVIATVNPNPTIIHGASAVCVGSSITLSNADAGGTWSITGTSTTLSGASTQTVTVAANSGNINNDVPTITYQFTSTGCASTGVLSVNVLPVVPVPTTAPACVGAPLTFSTAAANGSTTTGTLNYVWSGPVALSAVASPSVTATIGANGGIFSVTVTDSRNCSATSSGVTATVNPNPGSIDGPLLVCQGSGIILTDADGSGSWSKTGSSVSLGATGNPSVTVTGVSAGTSTITYAFNSTGCAATVVVTANTLPNISSVVTGGAVCVNAKLSFTANASPGSGGGTPSFTWSIPSGATALSATGTPTVIATTTAQSGIYTVTATDNRCSNLGTVTATVNRLPTLGSLSPSNNPVCAASSFTLNANAADGAGNAIQYTWTGSNGFTTTTTDGATPNTVATANSISANSVTATYSVTVTYPGLGCTSALASTSVVINPTPTVNATSASVCNGESPNLTVTANTFSTFTWIGTNNTNTNGATSAPTAATLINDVLTNGSSSVTSTATYLVTPQAFIGGCFGIAKSIVVTVYPTPVISPTTSVTTCGAFTLTPSVSFTGIPSTYTWTVGNPQGAAISGAGSGFSNTSTVSQVLSNGTNNTIGSIDYFITPSYTITGHTCTGSAATTTVSVNPGASLTGNSSTSMCSGTALNFTVTPTVTSSITWKASATTGTVNNIPVGTFTVDPVGLINPINTPALTNTSNTSPAIITFTVTPSSSGGGCSGGAAFVTVTVNPSPIVTYTVSPSVCSGTTLDLDLTASVGNSFKWGEKTEDAGISGNAVGTIASGTINDQVSNSSHTAAGVMVYSVFVTSPDGCSSLAEHLVTVNVNPIPVMTITPTLSTCGVVSLPLGASVASSFVWTLGASSFVSNAHSNSGGPGTSLTDNLSNTDLGHAAIGTQVYSITPTSTAGGCTNTNPFVLTVSVNPSPGLSSALGATVCSGADLNIPLVSTSGASTFTWGYSNTISGSLSSGTNSGGTSSITATLVNPSNSINAIVIYTVVPQTSDITGCIGNPVPITVTVYPTPSVTATFSSPICSGFSPAITFNPSVPSAIDWTAGSATIPAISGTASGSGLTINDILSNPSNTTQGIFVYSVIPTSTVGSCTPTSPVLFVVSVNPLPTVDAVDPISICSGTSPEIMLHSSIPSNFTYDTSVVAPGISGAVSGFVNPISQVLTNSNTTSTGNVHYLVTAKSKDASCVGTLVTTINVAVNPPPVVNYTLVQNTICSGGLAGITLIPSTPSSFSWTPSITGSITGANPGGGSSSINDALFNGSSSTSGSVTYHVTAISTVGSCNGLPADVTVQVNPVSSYSGVLSKNICSGFGSGVVLVATTPADSTSYRWAVDPANIFSATTDSSVVGISDTIDAAVFNPSNAVSGSFVYSITPTYTHNGISCAGSQKAVTVTVFPKPAVDLGLTLSQSVCSGTTPTDIQLHATTANPLDSFIWSTGHILPAGSIFDTIASGTTNGTVASPSVISQILVNSSPSASGTIDYTIIPVSVHHCKGDPSVLTVTVNPAPNVTTADESVCSGAQLTHSLTATTPGVSTYVWGLGSPLPDSLSDNHPAGTTSPINDILINASHFTPGIAVFTVVATSSLGCKGTSVKSLTVTVNPLPEIFGLDTSICSHISPDIKLANITSVPSNFTWSVTATPGVTSDSATAVTPIIRDVLTNTGNTTVNAIVFTVTPTSKLGCLGAKNTLTVSVNPIPQLTSASRQSICSESVFDYTATASTDGGGEQNTSFAWLIPSVDVNITPPVDLSGTSATIHQVLTSNQILHTDSVAYKFTLTSRGCSSNATVMLTIDPRPEKPTITASTPGSICANTQFQNFGANLPLDTLLVHYTWSVGQHASVVDSSTVGINRNILVNFPDANVVDTISVIAYVDQFAGCTSKAINVINVSASVADDPARVVYHNDMFICLQNNVDQSSHTSSDTSGYLWGFDEAGTLKADTLKNEVNQNYHDTNPNFDSLFYWVIVTHNGCSQKCYFNKPGSTRGTVPVAGDMGIKVYPNPAADNINIEFGDISDGNYTADIYDLTGRKVAAIAIKDLLTTVPVKELSTGCYIIECRKNGVKVAISRFIKN